MDGAVGLRLAQRVNADQVAVGVRNVEGVATSAGERLPVSDAAGVQPGE
jgi:hypothetical protein